MDIDSLRDNKYCHIFDNELKIVLARSLEAKDVHNLWNNRRSTGGTFPYF